ncbi:unnamed protein product [Urochloa decumbens]|uniref:Uncharacterized protein n=1 Tax=Urochloa decumbens TaxID=240449 RepID=A0ABC9DC65_9POAL
MRGGRQGIGDRGGLRLRGRRGFWIRLRGDEQGLVAEEGVDFVQDSEVGGGDEFFFVSDSDDEISVEVDEGLVAPDSEDPGASYTPKSLTQGKGRGCLSLTAAPHSARSIVPDTEEQLVHGVEEQTVEGVEVLEGLEAWQDIAGHAQPIEEVEAVQSEPHEQLAGAGDQFEEVRDSMLKILVPLYFEKNSGN